MRGGGRVTRQQVASLRVGDVLRSPSGKLRTIREVGSASVALSILRCSWTRRPYTVYVASDLIDWSRTGQRRRLRSPLDRALALELADRARRKLTCCDVEGIS